MVIMFKKGREDKVMRDLRAAIAVSEVEARLFRLVYRFTRFKRRLKWWKK